MSTNKILAKLNLILNNSIFFKIAELILNFISNLFSKSIIIKFINTKEDDIIQNSFFYHLVLSFFNILDKLQAHISKHAEHSFFIKLYNNLISYLTKHSFILNYIFNKIGLTTFCLALLVFLAPFL